MSYRLLILRKAERELDGLPTETVEQVERAVMQLAMDPRPRGCVKLTHRDGWRIRVGNYRVIYEVDDLRCSVTVTHIGHRRDVYR
jgi:mRNA interferase RelE/StbE